MSEDEHVEPQGETRCVCGDNQDFGTLMVCCDSCESWFHGACVGIMDEAAVPESYMCKQCKSKPLTKRGAHKGKGSNAARSGSPPPGKNAKKRKEITPVKGASGAASKKARPAAASTSSNQSDTSSNTGAAAAAAAAAAKRLSAKMGASQFDPSLYFAADGSSVEADTGKVERAPTVVYNSSGGSTPFGAPSPSASSLLSTTSSAAGSAPQPTMSTTTRSSTRPGKNLSSSSSPAVKAELQAKLRMLSRSGGAVTPFTVADVTTLKEKGFTPSAHIYFGHWIFGLESPFHQPLGFQADPYSTKPAVVPLTNFNRTPGVSLRSTSAKDTRRMNAPPPSAAAQTDTRLVPELLGNRDCAPMLDTLRAADTINSKANYTQSALVFQHQQAQAQKMRTQVSTMQQQLSIRQGQQRQHVSNLQTRQKQQISQFNTYLARVSDMEKERDLRRAQRVRQRFLDRIEAARRGEVTADERKDLESKLMVEVQQHEVKLGRMAHDLQRQTAELQRFQELHQTRRLDHNGLQAMQEAAHVVTKGHQAVSAQHDKLREIQALVQRFRRPATPTLPPETLTASTAEAKLPVEDVPVPTSLHVEAIAMEPSASRAVVDKAPTAPPVARVEPPASPPVDTSEKVDGKDDAEDMDSDDEDEGEEARNNAAVPDGGKFKYIRPAVPLGVGEFSDDDGDEDGDEEEDDEDFYERERREQIKKNQDMLAQLGLQGETSVSGKRVSASRAILGKEVEEKAIVRNDRMREKAAQRRSSRTASNTTLGDYDDLDNKWGWRRSMRLLSQDAEKERREEEEHKEFQAALQQQAASVQCDRQRQHQELAELSLKVAHGQLGVDQIPRLLQLQQSVQQESLQRRHVRIQQLLKQQQHHQHHLFELLSKCEVADLTVEDDTQVRYLQRLISSLHRMLVTETNHLVAELQLVQRQQQQLLALEHNQVEMSQLLLEQLQVRQIRTIQQREQTDLLAVQAVCVLDPLQQQHLVQVHQLGSALQRLESDLGVDVNRATTAFTEITSLLQTVHRQQVALSSKHQLADLEVQTSVLAAQNNCEVADLPRLIIEVTKTTSAETFDTQPAEEAVPPTPVPPTPAPEADMDIDVLIFGQSATPGAPSPLPHSISLSPASPVPQLSGGSGFDTAANSFSSASTATTTPLSPPLPSSTTTAVPVASPAVSTAPSPLPSSSPSTAPNPTEGPVKRRRHLVNQISQLVDHGVLPIGSELTYKDGTAIINASKQVQWTRPDGTRGVSSAPTAFAESYGDKTRNGWEVVSTSTGVTLALLREKIDKLLHALQSGDRIHQNGVIHQVAKVEPPSSSMKLESVADIAAALQLGAPNLTSDIYKTCIFRPSYGQRPVGRPPGSSADQLSAFTGLSGLTTTFGLDSLVSTVEEDNGSMIRPRKRYYSTKRYPRDARDIARETAHLNATAAAAAAAAHVSQQQPVPAATIPTVAAPVAAPVAPPVVMDSEVIDDPKKAMEIEVNRWQQITASDMYQFTRAVLDTKCQPISEFIRKSMRNFATQYELDRVELHVEDVARRWWKRFRGFLPNHPFVPQVRARPPYALPPLREPPYTAGLGYGLATPPAAPRLGTTTVPVPGVVMASPAPLRVPQSVPGHPTPIAARMPVTIQASPTASSSFSTTQPSTFPPAQTATSLPSVLPTSRVPIPERLEANATASPSVLTTTVRDASVPIPVAVTVTDQPPLPAFTVPEKTPSTLEITAPDSKPL